MKIGIDLINLRGLTEGLGRYTTQLLQVLNDVSEIEECHLFMRPEVAGQIGDIDERFHKTIVSVPDSRVLPWNQVYFALSRKARRLDFLHSPVSVSPMFSGTRTLLTVHDLAFEVFPEHYSRKAILYWKFALRRACSKATLVLAVSESTKRDLIEYMAVPEERIQVIYPFARLADWANTRPEADAIRARYHLPERYLLHVGAPHPREDLLNLVRAFRIVKERAEIPHILVLAGPKGWAIESLQAEIARTNMEHQVVLPGLIAEKDLSAVYGNADALVMPSLYEGFGYPPLEAMACGLPVIVSNTSSLPEVAGEAGLYFDPRAPADIAEKILQVLTNPSLAVRLKTLAQSRSRKFSIENMTSRILEAYQLVMASEY